MIKLNREFLDSINANYKLRVADFSAEDIVYNLDRISFREKLIGFMTPEYHKRKKLFSEGQIVYGYLCRSQQSANASDQIYVWVITSPEHHYAENPSNFAQIAVKMAEIDISKKMSDKKVLHFMNRILEPFADVKYLEIPGIFCDGHLAFISSVVYRPNHIHAFRHGLNLAISSPRISKELILLPEKYWPAEYYDFHYDKNECE